MDENLSPPSPTFSMETIVIEFQEHVRWIWDLHTHLPLHRRAAIPGSIQFESHMLQMSHAHLFPAQMGRQAMTGMQLGRIGSGNEGVTGGERIFLSPAPCAPSLLLQVIHLLGGSLPTCIWGWWLFAHCIVGGR